MSNKTLPVEKADMSLKDFAAASITDAITMMATRKQEKAIETLQKLRDRIISEL